MHWIKNGTALCGAIVDLLPLEEKYFATLSDLAEEQTIWEFIPIDMSTREKRYTAFSNAIIERQNGTQYTFVIFHKSQNRIIGSTRLMNIEVKNKKLEIGWTWLHPAYWASAVNLECKLLLLNFCFEELNAIRVQLKTDEHNIRSRRAIAKIGAQYEGILRNDMIRDNGTYRNSAYFSITIDEWKNAKRNLETLLTEKTNA